MTDARRFSHTIVRVIPAAGLALSSVFAQACGEGKAETPPPAPPNVSVITVAPETLVAPFEWIATLDGFVNAQIRPQVSGYLLTRNYDEGRARPTRARCCSKSIRGRLRPRSRRRRRSWRRPRRSSGRPSAIWSATAACRAARDRAKPVRQRHPGQPRRTGRRQVGDRRRRQRAAQSSASRKVTSLIDGVAAIATAQIGDLVGPATLLTTVSQVDPIKAYFPLSEQEYLPGRRAHQRVAGWRKAPWTRADGALTLVLADGSVVPARGLVPRRRSRDRSEDRHDPHQRHFSQSRSHRCGPASTVASARRRRSQTDALLVPQRAVRELQGAFQVRVVGDRQQGGHAHRHGRRTRRQPLDRRRRARRPATRVVVEGAATRDGAVVHADAVCRHRRGRTEPCPRFFIRRPIVAIVIAIVTVLAGLVAMQGAADRAVPGDHPAANHRDRQRTPAPTR